MTLYQVLHELQIVLALILGACPRLQPVTLGRLAAALPRPNKVLLGRRRARTGGLRLAQAACAVGLAYSAVSVYWAAGGAWLLSTVGDALGQQGRAGDLGIIVAVWAAAVLKFIGAILPLAAVGVITWRRARRRQVRVLAWADAGTLTIYGLVLAGAGWLAQSGVLRRRPSLTTGRLPGTLTWGSLVPTLEGAGYRCPGAVPATPRRPDRAQPQSLTARFRRDFSGRRLSFATRTRLEPPWS